MEKKNLVFSGGGSSSQHTESDSLRSEDTAELLIGLCEGPIEGLENGGQSLYLDDTPLLDSNGDENFEDYSLDLKIGDASQDESIKYTLGGTAKSHSVGLELQNNGSELTRQTSSANIDYIDVRITINSLYNQKSDGVYKATGKFRIEYRKSIDSDWKKYGNSDISIYGKTTSAYVRDYRIAVDRDEAQNVYYEVKVTRLTDASSTSGSGQVFSLYWTSYEEVDASADSFPGTALLHFTIKTSDQVTSLPEIYGIYKLLMIKVPSNYDPIAKTYDGMWDGTFKIAWTDNPAWCLYDLITNTTYGVNAYYPVVPDKWDFYEAAQYCDELVGSGSYDSNGNEIQEPRYTFNYAITDSQSGPEMLNYVAATFNGIIYEDSSGTVRLSVEDNEKQAVHIFNPTNITSGGFSYTFSEPSARYNDYTVSFVNPDLDWETDRRRVITPYGDEAIEEWGRIPYDYNAIGCIKESEAIRKTRFKLITSLKETMTVQFSTNRTMMNVNLFDTILICDPNMNWSQSGRIKTIGDGRTSIDLRDSVFLEAGIPYVIKFQTATGIFECNLQTDEVGRVYHLELDNILPDDVDEKAVFTLTGTGEGTYGDAKPFRVVSISESGGNQDQISVTATEIYRNKQTEADTGIILKDTDSSTRPGYGSIPQVLDCSFLEYFDESRMENALVVSPTLDWDKYPYYTGNIKVYSRLVGTEDEFEERDVENGNIIYDHPAGDYEFKVLPQTTLGLYPSLDKAPIFEFEVSEIAADKPDNVQNFKATGNVENITLTWDVVDGAKYYEIRMGESWEETTTDDIIATNITDTTYYYTDVEDGNVYKFLIKAFNSAGLESMYPTVAYGSLSAPKDVEKFYVTPNLDSLRFDWIAPNENYVEYEVRAGQAWESGYTLFTTSGDNQTVLNPGTDYNNTIYFIKAKSRKGIYSDGTLQAYTRQKLKQNRNVILEKSAVRVPVYDINSPSTIIGYEYDDTKKVYKVGADDYLPKESDIIGIIKDDDESFNVYDTTGTTVIGTMGKTWRGTCHGMTIASAQQPNIMQMSTSYFYGEMFFPVTLNEKTLARNWYDTEYFKFGDRLTFADLDFPWESEEARVTTWLNEQDNLNYGGRLKTMITWESDDDYAGQLGLRFNNTTSDVNETITPAEEGQVMYAPAKVDNGLILNKILRLKYNIDFEDTFSTRFRIYLSAASPDYLQIVRFSDGTNYMDIFLNDHKIWVVRSDGVKASAEYNYMTYLDFLTIQVAQDEKSLTLNYYLEYAETTEEVSVDCTPLTKFTTIYFGGQND